MKPKNEFSASSDSSSDDESDQTMRQFLEAADNTFLTNEMYKKPLTKPKQTKEAAKDTIEHITDSICEQKAPKSNRYILEDEHRTDIDFITTEAVRKHIAKKLTQIIAKNIEFCDINIPMHTSGGTKTTRSRIKLFAGVDSYVKPYEEFVFETEGSKKRPIIKRRKVDDEQGEETAQEHLCRLVAVSGEDIITGKLTRGWAPKRECKEKVTHYKTDAQGKLHLKRTENEFTKLRNKNQWNETKIKQKRNSAAKAREKALRQQFFLKHL